MSLFKDSTVEAAQQLTQDFTPFAEDYYNAVVQDVEVVQVQGTDWSSGSPVKTDEEVDSIRITFNLESTVDGGNVKGHDGSEPTFNTLSGWYDPIKVGITRRGPTKTRQAITSIMGWDIKADLTLDVLEDLILNRKMIGRKVKLFVEAFENKDGLVKNKISKYTAAKNKEEQQKEEDKQEELTEEPKKA